MLALRDPHGRLALAGPVRVDEPAGSRPRTALRSASESHGAVQIRYGLATVAEIRLDVYDVPGRHVRTLEEERAPRRLVPVRD